VETVSADLVQTRLMETVLVQSQFSVSVELVQCYWKQY